MAFSEDEKVQIRYHLGFMNVNELYTFAAGIAHSIPHMSLLEGAMTRVLPFAETKVRQILERLNETETQKFENQEAVVVTSIGDITIDPMGQHKFENVYLYWRACLGNLLAVDPNPYDQRFQNSGLNARVHHG